MNENTKLTRAGLKVKKRHMAKGKCRSCGAPLSPNSSFFCTKHIKLRSERVRKINQTLKSAGTGKRYFFPKKPEVEKPLTEFDNPAPVSQATPFYRK
jgi:hypothetical protein